MKRQALGKGLDALLPQLPPASEGHPDSILLELHLEQVHPNALQPRLAFEPSKLEELAASIKENGVIQPIVVRQADNERFRERFAELAGDDLVGLDDRIEALEALANLPPRVREVLDFGQLLEEVLAAREARIRDQQLLVVREIEAELPPLQADPTRMRVALETLLDCAVPPRQRGGDLYLAVRHLPAREGAGSIRLLLRSKQAPGETPSARRKPGDLRLALAALLLEGQGARLTLGEPNGDERLMLVDLTLA